MSEFRNKAAFDKCDFEHAAKLANSCFGSPSACEVVVEAPGAADERIKIYFGGKFPVSTNTDYKDDHIKIKVTVVSEV